jgi:60 kDa SS-A/Ro ribonucleoprotein
MPPLRLMSELFLIGGSMSIYTKALRNQPAKSKLVGREEMIENAAGGYTFEVSMKEMFTRFLILGTESGTYYASEQKLTLDATKEVVKFIKADGAAALSLVSDVIMNRRAPKTDASIFTLALIATYADAATQMQFYNRLPMLLNTGTHLFQFVDAVNGMRGWGRGLRRAVANWYVAKSPQDLAYQLVKYRQRNGWTHKDVIRLCHAKSTNPDISALIRYAVGKGMDELRPSIVQAFEAVQKEKSLDLIREYRLDREMLPTEYLNDKKVWEALLPHMKDTALVRNLATITAKEVMTSSFDDTTQLVVEKLSKVKLHPVNMFIALRTYSRGKGIRGSQVWSPLPKVVDALERNYMAALVTTEGSGKRVLYAQDISGSMARAVLGSVDMPAVEITAGIMHALNAMEKRIEFCVFNTAASPARIQEGTNVASISNQLRNMLGGGTDLSSPIQYAMDKKLTVDAFIIATDNEGWAGGHLSQKLEEYRRKFNKEAKLILLSLTATKNTVRDPLDKNSLEVVGFDNSVPELIINFIKEV